MLRLYLNPVSPFCRAASVHLAEKAIAHERLALTGGADRARLLAVSPTGEVPVLEVDDRVLSGSQAICDHADALAPAPVLMPTDPIARHDCQRITEIACSTTDALQFMIHLMRFRRPELVDARPEVVERLEAETEAHFAFLDEAARSGAEQIGAADPFFRSDRIHWRSHRVEWACRLGLAAWLAREVDEGQAFFPPPPRATIGAH